MARTARPAGYYEKNVREECGRCGGSGSVSWGADVKGVVRTRTRTGVFGHKVVERVCFTCNGVGFKMRSQANIDRCARNAERKAAQFVAEVAAKAAADAAAWVTWTTEHADVVSFLDAARAGEPGSFVFDMKWMVENRQALSERQVAAIRGMAERKAADAAVSAPVIEGRIVVTGEVLTTKVQDSVYGTTVKMLVRDDRGFKVWGTVPSALLGEDVKGKRVTFTATVRVSDNDETFGFYQRPTKAALVA